MINLLKAAALTLTTAVLLSGCNATVSKKSETTIVDTVKNGADITRDSIWQSGASVTNTKSTTTITVDPATNDSTIVTKTVIKHSKK